MDVGEKLVELLRNAKAAMKAENLSCDLAKNMFVVDFMMANGVTVQEWISVKDRLPDVCDSYIVCGKMKYSHEKEWEIFTDVAGSHGDYIDGFWDTFTDWNEGQEIHITHWQPMPQLPKGE